MLKLKKRSVVVLTDEDIKLVSGGLAAGPAGPYYTYTQTNSWGCPTSDMCGTSGDCGGGGSGGCASVYCDSHYCASADCNSYACGSANCGSYGCVSGDCQSYDCDSGGCQSWDCNSNGCQSGDPCGSDGLCGETTSFQYCN